MYHIAIVDDSEAWCFVLAQRLQLQGYTVSTFTEASLFLKEAHRFDLVLVDFLMPARRYQIEIDGIELIRQVKQHVSNPPLLILLSSFFTNDILHQASDLCPEANLCLSKTLESAELLRQIEQLLARKKSRQSSYADSLHSAH